MKKNIEQIIKSCNESYKLINDFASNNGDVELIDYVYPEHDGNPLADRLAELMELRQACSSLMNACEVQIEKCSSIINIDSND